MFIEDSERFDQLVEVTLDLDWVENADFKPLVNCYIQWVVHNKWDVSVHGRDL